MIVSGKATATVGTLSFAMYKVKRNARRRVRRQFGRWEVEFGSIVETRGEGTNSRLCRAVSCLEASERQFDEEITCPTVLELEGLQAPMANLHSRHWSKLAVGGRRVSGGGGSR